MNWCRISSINSNYVRWEKKNERMVSERWEKTFNWEDECFLGFVILHVIYNYFLLELVLPYYIFRRQNLDRLLLLNLKPKSHPVTIPVSTWTSMSFLDFLRKPLRGWTADLPFFPSSQIYYNSPELKDVYPRKLTWIPKKDGLEKVVPFKYGHFWYLC